MEIFRCQAEKSQSSDKVFSTLALLTLSRNHNQGNRRTFTLSALNYNWRKKQSNFQIVG